jgi:F-type H+-transporting ATPase subunit gamma
MSGKLRLYKDKLEGYKKFYSIIKTIKMVTMAKYQLAMARVKTRDFTLRYAEKAFSSVTDEAAAIAGAKGPLLYIPITSNRGSCGALNSSAYKYIESVLSPNCQIMAVGKKGNDSLSKLFPKEYKFSIINDMKQPMHFAYASFIWEHVLSAFPEAERTQLLYNRYVSAGIQRQAVYNIPSFTKWMEGLSDASSTENQKSRYLFANAVLDMEEETIRDYYDFQATLTVLNAVSENELSEQAARLVAVEGQLTNILTLQQRTNYLYNKTRQSSITASLIEILSAMSSLEGNAAKGVKREKFWQ